MRPDKIVIRGAREHNLKHVTVELPRDHLIVLTGVSGSGKSSLAFDTLYAEGQRRYVESLSSYARQFLGQQQKPAVDYIGGLSPAIAIEQKAASKNPRSTVGTVTEIHDYLRVLYARVGQPHCPQCGQPISAQTAEQIVDGILRLIAPAAAGGTLLLLAPVARFRKGEYQQTFEDARRGGFARVRVNGQVLSLDEPIKLDKKRKHQIDLVVDRLRVPDQVKSAECPGSRDQAPRDASPTPDTRYPTVIDAIDRSRLTDSVETALRFGEGTLVVAPDGGEDVLFSEKNSCLRCGISLEDLTPQMFSYNSPQGACRECLGLGTKMEVAPDLVVPDQTNTLRRGAVAPWGGRAMDEDDTWYARYRLQILAHYGIDLDTPYRDLPEEHQRILLYGGSGEKIKITWENKDGSGGSHFTRWEGLVPRIHRKLKQTHSDSMRQWYMQFMSLQHCPACDGKKLKPEARAVTVGGRSIVEVERWSVAEALAFFDSLRLDDRSTLIAEELLKEIRGRLQFLMNVGLHYLTLDRSAPSLSGGESQRIRLASQIGCGLVGVLYILDEPSIGLHQRDNAKLLRTLEDLRDIGNTVIVVEHDRETMLAADYIVDFGPGAGIHGGHVVVVGRPEEVARCPESLTGRYLAGELTIAIPPRRRPPNAAWLSVVGAREHNLKHLTVRFPLGTFICVAGVSGSGKSSLVSQILYKALSQRLMRSSERPGAHDRVEGLEHLDKVIAIDQDPIGRTPRSNPATYTGVWDVVRSVFATVPEARIRGYKPGRFSFNVKGGRCESCQGDGLKRIEMQFLPDVNVPCEVCKGKRFNRETLQVTFKGKSVADVLDMTVDEAMAHFANIPAVARILRTLVDVGMGYMKLGQPAPTLSGGEAQRVKLAKELRRPSTGRTLYVLDEPTTGLHFADIQKLLDVLHRFVDAGNTVVVIEHNLDVIKTADWIIDLGPEGGDGGGRLVASGTPEQVALVPGSFTGQFLRPVVWPGGVAAETAADGVPENGPLTPGGIRAVRLALGVSQEEAARAIGVSRGLLAEAERGRRAGERTLARIALGLRELAAAASGGSSVVSGQ